MCVCACVHVCVCVCVCVLESAFPEVWASASAAMNKPFGSTLSTIPEDRSADMPVFGQTVRNQAILFHHSPV